MRVLFVGLVWDYKDPRRGPSFERSTFWGSLRQMDGVDASLFPVDERELRVGRGEMNRELLRRVEELEPDLVFFFLFEDEIFQETVVEIGRQTTTLNWFADDHWRFTGFSRHWAPCFTWIATTDAASVQRYRDLGVERVLHTQWACNHHIFRPGSGPRDIPVSFVGQPHGSRGRAIERLRRRGLPISTWGHGWPEGRVSEEELIAILQRTQVNLNLANASPLGSPKSLVGSVKQAVTIAWTERDARLGIAHLSGLRRDQIKARNFEVPGCAGFLLTTDVAHLSRYYVLGEEVVTYANMDDLEEKIVYYLARDEEREAVARAGYERTIRDHTYEKRFRDIFQSIGLQ